jgi:hypothetical protein
VGVLLDLDDGSLRFFKNGVQHGPGFGWSRQRDRTSGCCSANAVHRYITAPTAKRPSAPVRGAPRQHKLCMRRLCRCSCCV